MISWLLFSRLRIFAGCRLVFRHDAFAVCRHAMLFDADTPGFSPRRRWLLAAFGCRRYAGFSSSY
jgi:hypothetical protein